MIIYNCSKRNRRGDKKMRKLYVVKTFGQYHIFNTEEARCEFIKTLPDWEAKHAETYEVGGGEK
jgi:hypothetical protein